MKINVCLKILLSFVSTVLRETARKYLALNSAINVLMMASVREAPWSVRVPEFVLRAILYAQTIPA